MKWVPDHTGRFQKRPHYTHDEIDRECEQVLMKSRPAQVSNVYPITTDTLTVLIEALVADLDLYADLSKEEGDVEGVTDFYPGRLPTVRISKDLSCDSRMANRLRTTLTHELGHVVFHSFMFAEKHELAGLFGTRSEGALNKCKRESILGSSERDWMEWQAGYACGAFLMPLTELKKLVHGFLEQQQVSVARFSAESPIGQLLILQVTDRFGTSREAARVRLSQLGMIQSGPTPKTLF